MKKSILEIQSEVENVIGNIAMTNLKDGDMSSKRYINNALESLKKIHSSLEEYKTRELSENKQEGNIVKIYVVLHQENKNSETTVLDSYTNEVDADKRVGDEIALTDEIVWYQEIDLIK